MQTFLDTTVLGNSFKQLSIIEVFDLLLRI